MIGQTLSHYRITAAIGAGGMGEVYRATDTKLGRDVAIKVLPSEVAKDPARLERFPREAHLLAALNHPHIAAIHGLEEADGRPFLVLELVEGEDLKERLVRGAIPVDEALEIAVQVAEALEEAHNSGIVHRDLKPANVKLTRDGKVKVLDFGLAKAWAGDAAEGGSSSASMSQSPTLAHSGTQAGVVLGTAAYMSPEQARGKPVDKRADTWALGVVLYEMLTGRPLFSGETVSDVLAAVLTKEVPWEELPPHLPRSAHTSLRRCLVKDPRRRLRDAGDLRLELEGEAEEPTPPRRRQPWLAMVPLGLACAAFGLWAGLALRGSGSVVGAKPTRLSMLLPEDRPYLIESWPARSLAIVPDGGQVAYVAEDPDAENGRRLFVRSLDDLDPRPVSGAEGAFSPFFSPDGQWLAYFTMAEGTLRKVPLSGGPSVVLTRGLVTAAWAGGSWSQDGWLVFHDWPRGLRVVPENGGEARLLEAADGEVFLHPQPLPGADRLLFTVERDTGYSIETAGTGLEGRRTVPENAYGGLYVDSGHLLFSRDGVLFVAPFDAEGERVTGPPVPLPFEVKVDQRGQLEPVPQLAVALDGTLAYVPTSGALDRECTLSWLGATGAAEPLGTLAARTPALRLSPDGTRLAISRRLGSAVRYEVLRLESWTTTLVDDVESYYVAEPVWHPDGRHLVVSRAPGLQSQELWSYDVEEESPPRRVAEIPGFDVSPHSFSPDGRYLSVTVYTHEANADILILDLGDNEDEGASLRPFVQTASEEGGARFSPDGRFVAYWSDESGRYEVYLRRFPGGDGLERVSVDGGFLPRWSPRGDEIYFASPSGDLLASRIETGGRLRVGSPRVVFEDPSFTGPWHGTSWDVAPDGRLLVRTLPEDPNRSTEIVVVRNWFQELQQLTESR